jgi:hypothetical protein
VFYLSEHTKLQNVFFGRFTSSFVLDDDELVNSTEQYPFVQVDIYSAEQEILCLVWNPMVRHSFHNSPPLVLYPWPPESSSHPFYLRDISMSSFHLRAVVKVVSFLKVFRLKCCIYFPMIDSPHPTHPPWFVHPDNMWLRVKIVQLLTQEPYSRSTEFI